MLILLCLTQVVEQGPIVGRVHVSANEKINTMEAKELNEDNCTCPNQKPREQQAIPLPPNHSSRHAWLGEVVVVEARLCLITGSDSRLRERLGGSGAVLVEGHC